MVCADCYLDHSFLHYARISGKLIVVHTHVMWNNYNNYKQQLFIVNENQGDI